MNQDRFRKFLVFLAGVVVVLAVLRQGVTVGFPPSPKEVVELLKWFLTSRPIDVKPAGQTMFVTRADILLVITAILWVIWLAVKRRAASPGSVAIAVFLLGIWPLVSWAGAAFKLGEKQELLMGRREALQYAAYFIFAFALFATVLRKASARGMAFVFLLAGAAAVGVGVYILVQGARGAATKDLALTVAGFEGWPSHARLAVVLAPMFFGLAAFDSNFLRQLFWGIATLAALGTCIYGPLIVVALLVILVLAMLRSERLFALLAVLLLILLPFAGYLPWGSSRDEAAKELWLASPSQSVTTTEAARLKGEACASALTAIRQNVLLGKGPSASIEVPSLKERLQAAPTEQDRIALAGAATPAPYLLTAATMGVPMVVFFIWVFVLFAKRSLSAFVQTPEPIEQALAMGLFGAVLVFAIGSAWVPTVVHETGIVLAFLLACIWRLSEAEPFIEPPRPARTKQKAKPTDLLLDLS